MQLINIKEINEKMKPMNPFERVEWALKQFGDKFCATSSFGIQSAMMSFIIHKVDSNIPILFIDTGYHFSETLAYKEYLQKIYQLNIVTIKPDLTRIEFEMENHKIFETDPDFCCKYNKVIPLKMALKNYNCWATGIRRKQGEARQNIPFIVQANGSEASYKLIPLADFDEDATNLFYKIYPLPLHPLLEQGYTSVGCLPCTAKSLPGDDERAGRWKGKTKTECGIHMLHGNGEGI